MSVSSIGAQSALIMQQLVQMRAKFDDLQRQLGTGQKSATYAGLGIDRGVTVSLNSQLSAISGYDNTIDNVMARVNLMNTALGNMIDVTSTVKSAMVQANGVSNGGGAQVAQQTALSSLDQLIGIAQFPGRRSLSVFGPRHRPARGGTPRSHLERRRHACRPQAAHRRA